MALEIVWRNPLARRSAEHKVQPTTNNHQVRTARRTSRGKVIRMKARKPVLGILSAVGIAMMFVLLTAINGEAQSPVQAPESHVMTARIPFDFWIGGAHLPAGDYTLNFILDTLVLFRNAASNAQEQVFLMPTGETAGSGQAKLVFIEQDHHYYLQELWTSSGAAVLAWRTAASLNQRDARVEIPLTQDRRDKMVAGK